MTSRLRWVSALLAIAVVLATAALPAVPRFPSSVAYYPDGHHTTTCSYDARGRLTTTTYADGTTSATVYDGAGNALTRTDQAGHATAYGYDDVGDLTGVTDANHHPTAYAYDALGRQTGKTWPDGSSEAWAYDPATGDQTAHTLADGHTTTYSYDKLDRLTGIAYFDGTGAAFTYTPAGQRATATDSRGATSYAYDAQDRLTGITTPSGQRVGYTYDAAGNRTALTTPGGTTAYRYDSAGRLAGLTDPQHGSYTYLYDAAGNRTGLSYPNGVAASYAYDGLNRLTSISYQRGGSTVASYAYTLAPDGTRTDLAEADGSATHWAYDAANRLTGETMQDGSGSTTYQASYAYDRVGNRTGQTVNGAATTYSYNSLDQLTGSTSGSATTGYTYNGRGDLTTLAAPSGTTTYTWDAADRLAGATLPDGTAASYGYDADGRRVSQTVTPAGGSAGTTNYLWDEASAYGDVVAETDGSGTLTAGYTLADDQLLAQTRGSTSSYYLTDGQGSTRALTNSSGGVTDTYRYDGYGNLLTRTGTATNPYLYTGQQFDATTGLYDLRARYRSPTAGQFLSRDRDEPAAYDPQSVPHYIYAADDPINQFDPSGNDAIAINYAQELDLTAVRTAAKVAALGVAAACPLVLVASLVAGSGGVDLGALQRSLLPAPLDRCVGNQVRVQLQENQQLRGGQGRTQGVVAVNLPKPGVTTRQVRNALWVLFLTTPEWFPRNRYERDLRRAIVRVSQKLKDFPPLGIDVENYSIPALHQDFPDGQDYYRVDVENVRGWNLRE